VAIAKKAIEQAQAEYNLLLGKKTAPIFAGVKQYYTSSPPPTVESGTDPAGPAISTVSPTEIIKPFGQSETTPLNELSLDERIERQIEIDKRFASQGQEPMTIDEEERLLCQ
jgi:hypothetical protein